MSPEPQIPARIKYVPALDGMRGVSLPGTIYTHYSLFLYYLPQSPLSRRGPTWLSHAQPFTLNIEMFFVLSGALITSLLVSERQRTGTISFQTFYLRRSRRLGPALLAIVPILLILQFTLHGPVLKPLGPSPRIAAASVLLFVGNWRVIANGVGLGWLGPAWTLGIEEQFYLTWPLLLGLMLRRRWSRRTILQVFATAIVISIAIASIAFRHLGFQRTFYLTPTQLPPILLGCALGYAMTTRPDSSFVRLLRLRTVAIAGLGVMVAISVVWSSDHKALVSGGYALYGAGACLLIGHCFAVADGSSVVSRFFAWRPFVVIGQVSYEAYLVHVVIIFAVVEAWPTMSVNHMIVLDTALIAAVSGAFYYLIERPIRRKGWRGAFARPQPKAQVNAA